MDCAVVMGLMVLWCSGSGGHTMFAKHRPQIKDREAAACCSRPITRKEALAQFLRAFSVAPLLVPVPASSAASTLVPGEAGIANAYGTDHGIRACSSSPRTVVVAGADGRTGQEVVRQLVDRGVGVRAGVRNAPTAKNQNQPGVTPIKLDVTG